MSPVLYVDLRSLQDPNYRFRGIGSHIASILRSRLRSRCADCRIVGLVEDGIGELLPEHSTLVDEVDHCWNALITKSGAAFIDCSPMTHDPSLTMRFTSERGFFRAALIYDFIPFDWPGYTPDAPRRIEYLARVLRLRSMDAFFPISKYSAWRLADILAVPQTRIVVTGASVRGSLYESASRRAQECSPYDVPNPYFFMLGGGDRRKNTEAPIHAVRLLNQHQSCDISLKIVGQYDPLYKAELLRAAGHEAGQGFVEFLSGVDDKTLADLYAGAIATIVPSHIEGFSLPVVEAAVCGSPVLASTCGAHVELIGREDAMFASDDYEGLAEKLAVLLRNPACREKLIKEQAPLAGHFHEDRVGQRFWDGLARRLDCRPPFIALSAKPKIAFVSPYPPDRSGVARYTQHTIEAASRLFDVDLYTNAQRPLDPAGTMRDAGRIGYRAFLANGYAGVVSVIGNSEFHIPILELFEKYGGPCILHDSRLIQIYHHRLGPKRFARFAASILSRPVTDEEVRVWLQDRDLPSLFVEPIIKASRPIIVHTRPLQALLFERYQVRAELAPCCPNMHFTDDDISKVSRYSARRRLGISDAAFVISTFGFVSKVKGFETCIIALEMLRGWGIPAELHFVGSVIDGYDDIRRIASDYSVEPYVHVASEFLDNDRYCDFMLASDAAVQLRAYGLGQFSAALADCVAAGLPAVATTGLAEACDAPAYVSTVPEWNSPLQIAEKLAAIHDAGERARCNEARRAYLDAHNFDRYARRLFEILQFG
jgi:glycosyltransferase involved in cell wall biosynthesis